MRNLSRDIYGRPLHPFVLCIGTGFNQSKNYIERRFGHKPSPEEIRAFESEYRARYAVSSLFVQAHLEGSVPQFDGSGVQRWLNITTHRTAQDEIRYTLNTISSVRGHFGSGGENGTFNSMAELEAFAMSCRWYGWQYRIASPADQWKLEECGWFFLSHCDGRIGQRG